MKTIDIRPTFPTQLRATSFVRPSAAGALLPTGPVSTAPATGVGATWRERGGVYGTPAHITTVNHNSIAALFAVPATAAPKAMAVTTDAKQAPPPRGEPR